MIRTSGFQIIIEEGMKEKGKKKKEKEKEATGKECAVQ